MKILLKGADSFIGLWFARELALMSNTVLVAVRRACSISATEFRQTGLAEPLLRVNTDFINGPSPGWCEEATWD
jgi:short-subunit dehydrogenase involved in D-alanine esterification of teichoic acids